MRENWQRERILIWGKTRPEISQKYAELVCTGGLLERTKKLIRLYPVPLRYLDDQRIFRKYQWIEANICKSPKDTRPESYKIDFNDIEIKEKIDTSKGNWDRRAEWILHSENLVTSVEEIQNQQIRMKRSLGIIAPKSIQRFSFEPFSMGEIHDWKKKYDAVLAQGDLQFMAEEKRDLKPIPPPDFRFKVGFRCDDRRCMKDHSFSILDWEIDALYNNLRNKGDTQKLAATKVIEKLEENCCSDNDVRFFLGNISSHPKMFTIVGLWYPKKSELLENKMPLLMGLNSD